MMEDGELFDGETGFNADALKAVGKSLPHFGELLRLCGLISRRPALARRSKDISLKNKTYTKSSN